MYVCAVVLWLLRMCAAVLRVSCICAFVMLMLRTCTAVLWPMQERSCAVATVDYCADVFQQLATW